jgi:Glycosyltransferase
MGFDKRVVHLPNFIDMEKFRGSQNNSDNETSIVYLGRLSSEKGLLTLLKAVKILNDKIKIALNIIGEGPIRGELEKKAKAEGMDNVRFHGYMKGEKLYDELRKNQVVIIPSEWYENNPISVLEAFALGKPVIGSRIGGIPELVRDGETGYTFEPGNAGDLCDKVMMLLSDDTTRNIMGQNARKFVVTKFNPEKHYQELMEIYQSVIEMN